MDIEGLWFWPRHFEAGITVATAYILNSDDTNGLNAYCMS